jgi:hypothetical protein
MAKARRERKPRPEKKPETAAASEGTKGVWTCTHWSAGDDKPAEQEAAEQPLTRSAAVLDAAMHYRTACAMVKTVEQIRDRAAARLLEIAGGVQPNA